MGITGDTLGQTQTVWVNNVPVISQVYDIRAAGDVDVIQRQEKIQQMMQDWPVIQNTPLRDRFLIDLLKLKYPDTGEQYAQILSQTGMMVNLQSMVARLGMVLEGALQSNPDMLTKLPPEQQADVGNMIKQAAAVAQQMQASQPQQQ
jgi:hypothetical protein